MVKVRIPTPLRPLTGGKNEVEATASDIQSMIESLNGQFPGLKDRVCDDKGEIRRFVNIYLNEEDIRFLQGKDTPLKDGDEISIVPAIAGGCQINREFTKVDTNIRRADVREKTGWMDVEFAGDPAEIERAIDGIRKKGVIVDPIELNVVE
ncbi:MAG: putative molybdopterin converting factor small subunit MoaD [bacterium]|nr:MAG: putative molybdopterin converting factor small subunit MoaD [bacterium]